MVRRSGSKQEQQSLQKKKCKSIKESISDFFVLAFSLLFIGGVCFCFAAAIGESCSTVRMRKSECGHWCKARMRQMTVDLYKQCFDGCEDWDPHTIWPFCEEKRED